MEQAIKAQRGVQIYLYSFFNVDVRCGCVVNATPLAHYLWERYPGSIVQEVEWFLRSVWKDAENLTPTRIRSPDRPAHSESLYRLRSPRPPLFKDLFYSIDSITARQITLVVSEVSEASTCFDTDGPSSGGTRFLCKRTHNSHSVWPILMHLLIRRGLFTLELLWGPPSLLYGGYRVFPGGKEAGPWCWHPLALGLRMGWSYTSSSCPCLHRHVTWWLHFCSVSYLV